MHVDVKRYGQEGSVTLILAHGAGAGMESEFMTSFARGFADRGINVLLFNFPYMIKRQLDGKKRPPDRAPKLLAHYRDLIAEIAVEGPMVIGGKSMGGRIASMLLAEDNSLADGLILLGYPFVPPGKPENLRVEHFPKVSKPVLIIQGERDVFGGKNFVQGLSLPENFHVFWSRDGDHSLVPRKKTGISQEESWKHALEYAAEYILSRMLLPSP